jgi:coproporphyrinogen III oxidase-like Fe-S oxidoreductase
VLRGDHHAHHRFVDHLLAELRGWSRQPAEADRRALPTAGGGVLAGPESPRWRWPHREPFDTVYLGGGTPTELPADELARLFAALGAALPVSGDAWISLEANPEDVTPASCAAWRALGVRTLSLGVQSFRDEELRFLGRAHRGEDARRALETALAAGFPIVSVDLIFGLPGQTPADLGASLEVVRSLEPPHVSGYQLTLHQGTPFGFRHARGQLAELPEPAQAALFRHLHETLAATGWAAYEVSNFARSPADRSRHNRKYWRHLPYLGLGPSAHSLAWAAGDDPPETDAAAHHRADRGTANAVPNPPAPVQATRFWNERKTPPWERRIAASGRAVAGSERLEPRQLALEALLLGLRTTDGVDLVWVRERTGCDLLGPNAALCEQLVREGLLDERALPDRLCLSLAGLAVADGLAASFRIVPA